jgi:hypothetical protein
MQGKDQRSNARDECEVPWDQENVRFPLFGTIHKGYGNLRTSQTTIPFYIVDDRNIREYSTGHESYCSSANYG